MMTLYEADFFTWAKSQAEAVRRRSTNELDWDRLAEELEALGASEQRELFSRYVVLLTHLLKWTHQPERRTRSWSNTIAAQRAQIARHLARNPGLKSKELEEFAAAYTEARLSASTQTDLDVSVFPETAAFSMDEAKEVGFLPE
jgi:Domain of unknown function DUF29